MSAIKNEKKKKKDWLVSWVSHKEKKGFTKEKEINLLSLGNSRKIQGRADSSKSKV